MGVEHLWGWGSTVFTQLVISIYISRIYVFILL